MLATGHVISTRAPRGRNARVVRVPSCGVPVYSLLFDLSEGSIGDKE